MRLLKRAEWTFDRDELARRAGTVRQRSVGADPELKAMLDDLAGDYERMAAELDRKMDPFRAIVASVRRN